MKIKHFIVLSLVMLGFTGNASAMTFTLDDDGGNGMVIDTSNPEGFYWLSFTMTGSDTESGDQIITSYTAVNDTGDDLTVFGDFTYQNADIDGPGLDPFGYIIDGLFTQLTDDEGDMVQIGSFSFDVAPGSIFGWYIDATDDSLGASMITVGANLGAVPVPAAVWLMLTAVAGLPLLRRRA